MKPPLRVVTFKATPAALEKLKKYRGTDNLGPPVINNESRYPNHKSERFRRKGNTVIELLATALYLEGFTIKSIAATSEEIFGVKLGHTTIERYIKNVLDGNPKRYIP